ncbi:WD repeat and FYVE domain-containing protein 2 [Halocaridina rubra]|uniref:WD repeat and FYVE domain-containing protein 2 n=1 Tax=Halocaridina rubra TaxID=373956 RepID=A0AAN9A5M8_HALRR
MAAEIKPIRNTNPTKPVNTDKPVLVSKIEGSSDDVNAAVLLNGGAGVISVSDDKSVRIWQRRDNGQYWPSVCHFLPSIPSTLYYTASIKRLLMGLDNGTVTEYEVAQDYNSIKHLRDYISHQSRVTGVIYCRDSEWALSVARDKFFVYHCTESGRRLGGHQCSGWCTALQYDYKSRHVFVGDYSGSITMLKLEENGPQVITNLKGHNGSIRSLAWDIDRQLLFSGSFDQSVIVWDIGGGKGTAFELQGHTNKVSALVYGPVCRQLISGGEDATVVFWDMKANRQEYTNFDTSHATQLLQFILYGDSFLKLLNFSLAGNADHRQ